MKTEGLLPNSQVPATCPYPELDNSSPGLPIPRFVRSILILYFHLSLGTPSDLFPSKTLYASLLSPICATCPANLIFLDLITRMISSEYRSYSSWLCSLFHSPVTSSLLGSNILLSTLFSDSLSLCSSVNVTHQISDK